MNRPPILDWIIEYELVSNQRQGAHELNNYMTPLAMQISMLKQHLMDGNLEKANLRIQKLERAAEKLKDFSTRQLIQLEGTGEGGLELTPGGVDALLESISRHLECPRPVLKLTLDSEQLPSLPDKKLFTLLLVQLMKPSSEVHELEIETRLEEKDFKLVIIATHNNAGNESSEINVLERFKKIFNATSADWKITTVMASGHDFQVSLTMNKRGI